MRLSVALCTYNGEKYLSDQLTSISGQTRLPDEMVICDDLSSDNTPRILSEFKANAPFAVKIYFNDKNLGSTKNFEKAIQLCSGNFIALSDQDDVWKPHKLERTVEVLQANPKFGYTFSDADLVDQDLRPLNRTLWDAIGLSGSFQKRFYTGEQFPCLIQKGIVTGATMAFRAEVAKLAMPFPAEGWVHDRWISMVSSATGLLGVPVEKALISYRQHSQQQIGAPKKNGSLSLLSMCQDLRKNNRLRFSAWERKCLQILLLKTKLNQLQKHNNSPTLKNSLMHLQDFETHFLNRKQIMTTKDFGRYALIIQEAFSGRYAQFSDSWRSIFRDLILNQTDSLS